jgi:hypothetical protein
MMVKIIRSKEMKQDKLGYQPRNNFVKAHNGYLLAEYNILNRWKNCFSQLLNVHNVSDVWHIEMHTAEPLVPGPSCPEAEIATAKLKSINCQVVIKFWQNWLKQEVKYYCLWSTNSLILFGTRKNCLISGRSLIVPIHKTGCNNYHGISLLSTSYKILLNILSQG